VPGRGGDDDDNPRLVTSRPRAKAANFKAVNFKAGNFRAGIKARHEKRSE
jgi:hypothetical protein